MTKHQPSSSSSSSSSPLSSLKERMCIAIHKPSAERRLDAEELIRKVLPHCQVRPYVYNQIARLAQDVQNEADALANKEAMEDGEQEYIPLKRTSFVLFIPGETNSNNSDNQYTLHARRLDIALLQDILTRKRCARRAYVLIKLNRGRKVLLEELVAAEQSQQVRAKKNRREQLLTLQSCTAVLPHLRDRPNLYHQVSSHISMLVEDDGGDWSSSTISSHSSGFQNNNNNNNNNEENSESSSSPPSPSPPSQEELWKDVRRLDEIIEFMTDGTFVKGAFQAMKQNIEMEARALQQLQAQLETDQAVEKKSKSGGGFKTRTTLDPAIVGDLPFSYL